MDIWSIWRQIAKKEEERRKREEQFRTIDFQLTGRIYPNQFVQAGDMLVELCQGWRWKPSLNPKYQYNYLPKQKQFLIYEKALCRKRLPSKIINQAQIIQKVIKTEDDDEIILIESPHEQKQINNQEYEQNQEDFRIYTMHIIYDEYYHVPRMYFSATNIEGIPISSQDIKDDVQNQYLERTFTLEQFPFVENTRMASIHPCRHNKVLKFMSDIMRYNDQKIPVKLALLIFLKFVQTVVPYIQFQRVEISPNSEQKKI